MLAVGYFLDEERYIRPQSQFGGSKFFDLLTPLYNQLLYNLTRTNRAPFFQQKCGNESQVILNMVCQEVAYSPMLS